MPNRWDMPPMYVQSGDPETENIIGADHYPGLLGARYEVINPQRAAVSTDAGRSKMYQRVKTDSTMTVTPFRGAVAWWADKTQYMVTTTVTTLGRGRIAGVFKGAVTPGAICFVQISGPSIVKYVDAPTAAPTTAGLFVIPSATNGKADCVSTAPAFPILGYTASIIAGADSTGFVDLDVPQTT
jgi:hypothetical protein